MKLNTEPSLSCMQNANKTQDKNRVTDLSLSRFVNRNQRYPLEEYFSQYHLLCIKPKLCSTVKPSFSGPSDEGTPAVLGRFCSAWIGFQL